LVVLRRRAVCVVEIVQFDADLSQGPISGASLLDGERLEELLPGEQACLDEQLADLFCRSWLPTLVLPFHSASRRFIGRQAHETHEKL
jgi:hypothetical protein